MALINVRQDQARIEGDIRQLVALRGGAKLEHGSLQYHSDWPSFSNAAWRTSQSSGALNFIDYRTAASLSGRNMQQQIASDRGLIVFDDQSRANAPGEANPMSTDEIQIVLLRSADMLLQLKGLEQLLAGLDEQLAAEPNSETADR